MISHRKEDGIDIVALGVTDDVKESELKGISGYDVVTMIDYFDEFHELANLLLEASKYLIMYMVKYSWMGIHISMFLGMDICIKYVNIYIYVYMYIQYIYIGMY